MNGTTFSEEQRPIANFTLMEIEITSTTNLTFLFSTNEILANKRIVGIAVYRRNAATDVSPRGRVLVPDVDIDNGYLEFLCDNVRVVDKMPLKQIAVDANQRQMYPVDVVGISPTKSSITFATAGTLATTQSVLVGISYVD